FLRADFGALSVVSVYLPSGSSSEERQQAKFRFLDEFMPVLKGLRAGGREFVLCGDWNIAHKEIDLENWRGNRNNSGFLPEERAWLSETFDGVGWVDVLRKVYPRPRQYTRRSKAWTCRPSESSRWSAFPTCGNSCGRRRWTASCRLFSGAAADGCS